MKRFVLTFFIIFFGWFVPTIAAQAPYRVYAVKGSVFFKGSDDTQWVPMHLDMPLNAIDSILITKQSTVRIVSELQNNIYAVEEYGIFSVIDYIDKAKSRNAQYVSNGVITEIETGKKQALNSHPMNVVGIGSRGLASRDTLEMLADKFAWIGALACSGIESPTIEGIIFNRYNIDGEWDFDFWNRSDKDYHINVLHVNKRTNIASLCYVITPDVEMNSCPITPSGYSACAMSVYFPNTEYDVYVLVATEYSYDTEAMDIELVHHPIDKATETNIEVQYMWK